MGFSGILPEQREKPTHPYAEPKAIPCQKANPQTIAGQRQFFGIYGGFHRETNLIILPAAIMQTLMIPWSLVARFRNPENFLTLKRLLKAVVLKLFQIKSYLK